MNIQILRPVNGGKDLYVIKDAKIRFKDFGGTSEKGNGGRSVTFLIDEDDKNLLESRGYTVHAWLDTRTNEYQYTIRLNVKMDPGNMAEITQRVGNNPESVYLDNESCGSLDRSTIVYCDVAWNYGTNKYTGKPVAYLKRMDVIIAPNIFGPGFEDYYQPVHD